MLRMDSLMAAMDNRSYRTWTGSWSWHLWPEPEYGGPADTHTDYSETR
jgi:hypothetical protein